VEGFPKDHDPAAAGVVDPNEGVGALGVPNNDELPSAGLLELMKLNDGVDPVLGCDEGGPNRLAGGFGSLPAVPNVGLDSPALLLVVFCPLPNEKPVLPDPNKPPPDPPDVPNKEPDEVPEDADCWKLNVMLRNSPQGATGTCG
jgi:hypothetical protein